MVEAASEYTVWIIAVGAFLTICTILEEKGIL